MESNIRKLIEYIAENSESESVFLSSTPSFSISSIELLDEIVEIFNLSKEEVGEIVDAAIDAKKERR